jgi:hypothetical protein
MLRSFPKGSGNGVKLLLFAHWCTSFWYTSNINESKIKAQKIRQTERKSRMVVKIVEASERLVHLVVHQPAFDICKLLIIGAGDGDRTRDIQLGKLAFYR